MGDWIYKKCRLPHGVVIMSATAAILAWHWEAVSMSMFEHNLPVQLCANLFIYGSFTDFEIWNFYVYGFI